MTTLLLMLHYGLSSSSTSQTVDLIKTGRGGVSCVTCVTFCCQDTLQRKWIRWGIRITQVRVLLRLPRPSWNVKFVMGQAKNKNKTLIRTRNWDMKGYGEELGYLVEKA